MRDKLLLNNGGKFCLVMITVVVGIWMHILTEFYNVSSVSIVVWDSIAILYEAYL